MSPIAESLHNHSTKNDGSGHIESARYAEALEDAERLLKYAAEVGTEVDARIRDGVLAARAGRAEGWNETTIANLLESLTKLAAKAETCHRRKSESEQSRLSFYPSSVLDGSHFPCDIYCSVFSRQFRNFGHFRCD